MEYNIYPKSDTEEIENKIVENFKKIRKKKCSSFCTPKEANPYTQLHLSKYLHEKTRFIKKLEEGIIKLDLRIFINLCNRLKISSCEILSEFIIEDMKISSNNSKKRIDELPNTLSNDIPQIEHKKYSKEMLGQEINKHREIKNLSQKTLSEKLGFSRTYINNIEKGNHNVSMSAFIDICNGLECTPNDLLYPFINSRNSNNDDTTPKLEQNIVDTSKETNISEVKEYRMSPEELEEFNRKYPKQNIQKPSKKEDDSYIEKYNLY